MNGAEHYKKSERMLEVLSALDDAVARGDTSPSGYYEVRTLQLAEAQVHATLALTAAVAERQVERYIGDESTGPRLWTAAIE